VFVKNNSYWFLIVAYGLPIAGIASNHETTAQHSEPSYAFTSAATNKHRLIPESSMDEDDIEESEILQPVSINDSIQATLSRAFQDPQFNTKKISLATKGTDVRDAIAMIGKSIGVDFIVDSDIKGTLDSINIKDQTAGHALELVCKHVKPEAALIKLGSIWHIMPREEAKKALANATSKDHVYSIFPVKHANMDQQFNDKVKDVWKGISHSDPEAYLHIDEDHKRVHVRASREAMLEIKRYIAEVDKPIMQVRIDVVIISARKDFMFEFGLDWSGMYNREQTIAESPQPFNFYGLGGTPLDFPNPKDKDSYTTASPSAVVPSPPNKQNPNLFVNPLNFAINLFNSGAAFFTGDLADTISPGLIRIPFVFGGPDLSYKRLNIMLNMAEIEQKISVISRPSILTSNNKIAKILIGQSLPLQISVAEVYDQSPASNRTTNTLTYKDIGIVLEVRPLVNPDKKSVYLNILVEESIVEAGTTRTNERGVMTDPPTIAVIKTKNEVVLRNGQTTVIGGLASRESSSVKRSVPFFSKIPLIGELFKAKFETNKERERYIFITPKIVEYEA